jgi:hypothetical protein
MKNFKKHDGKTKIYNNYGFFIFLFFLKNKETEAKREVLRF